MWVRGGWNFVQRSLVSFLHTSLQDDFGLKFRYPLNPYIVFTQITRQPSLSPIQSLSGDTAKCGLDGRESPFIIYDV